MEYDDIVVGSGLSALGTVLGLDAARRVLVLGGAADGVSQYYTSARTVPCAHLAFGGLGNFWHGVIPVGLRATLGDATAANFAQLFDYFFPGEDIAARIGSDCVFVPWRAIRPAKEWPRLAVARTGLTITRELALDFARDERGVTVRTAGGSYRAARLWMCAGPLQTPALLSRSLGVPVERGFVSDHVLCYLGQVDRGAHPVIEPARVERTRRGMWLQCWFDPGSTALYSLRPARFEFRRMDWGIERRAVFGLPMTSAIKKILRSASPGLVAEAVYNRMGIFPGARFQSAYAQIVVPDAHSLEGEGDVPMTMREEVIRRATDIARARSPWAELNPSRRPELFIPVIHLHHTVELDMLRDLDVNGGASRVQIQDASIYQTIGPEHHSFKMMAAAQARARNLQ